ARARAASAPGSCAVAETTGNSSSAARMRRRNRGTGMAFSIGAMHTGRRPQAPRLHAARGRPGRVPGSPVSTGETAVAYTAPMDMQIAVWALLGLVFVAIVLLVALLLRRPDRKSTRLNSS